jgi:hypothetical protein
MKQTCCSFQIRIWRILVLKENAFSFCHWHMQRQIYLPVIVADFLFHRRCGDHRLSPRMVGVLEALFHTALKSLVSLDAPRHWLRWHTHGNLWICNCHGGNILQIFCNRAKPLLVLFGMSLLWRTFHPNRPTNGRMIFNFSSKMK